MKNRKQLGVYMDHAHAFLMELENGLIISRSIVSEWNESGMKDTGEKHFMGFNCSEKKQLQMRYYAEISYIIRHYHQVVLFGPTDAKNEMNNLLNDNHLFNDIKVELVNTDKLTNIEMHSFMKDYFKN